jgi:hypothetical protein
MEKKLIEKSINEERLRKENESFKRQIQFYKEKMKLDIVSKRIKSPVKKNLIGSESNDSMRKMSKKNNEMTPERESKHIKISKPLNSSDFKKQPFAITVICSNLAT